MIAYLTELFAGVPETFHRTRKPASIPEELLTTVRKQNPGLQIDDAFVMPLWFFQQRTWFEDPAGSDSAVYNFSHLLRIRGPLNESALRQSLQELVRRHSVLRSVFRVMEGKLIQIILAPQPFALSATQLSGSAGEKNQQLQVAAHAEARQPFYLANGPMLRAKLMRLQPDEHVLQLTTHHLTYDDWSNGVLIHELGGLYRAFAEGTTPSGSPARYQYRRFRALAAKAAPDSGMEIAARVLQATTGLADGLSASANRFSAASTERSRRGPPEGGSIGGSSRRAELVVPPAACEPLHGSPRWIHLPPPPLLRP